MKVAIITSSPNKDGLTAACGEAAWQGAVDGKAEAFVVCLNDLKIGSCQACDNGWGTCNKVYECQVKDQFQELHKTIGEADAYVVITPVYWGEMSESAKAFFDRLRRCEASRKDQTLLQGKPVIAVAAAGGSGNGTMTCLASLERLFMHLRAEKFDLIAVTRKNRSYILENIRTAVRSMALSLK